MATPELIGRVVFVEGPYTELIVFQTLEGIRMRGADPEPNIWIVSSNAPLPSRTKNGVLLHSYKRPIGAECLRPLLDPDLDVSDKEVKELYSTKEKECLVSQ
jgi:hypothetical protein